MNKEYNHPGIYIDDISHLPKSVAQVETAIPAFIGFTEKALFNGKDFHLTTTIQPVEINSFNEFELIFGYEPEPLFVEFELDENNRIISSKTKEISFLYFAVKLFFENGGITCLIVSVGNFFAAANNNVKEMLLKGLNCLDKTDAVTLLVMPDAATLTYADAAELHQAMLVQSEKLKNRFALLDLTNGNVRMDDLKKPIENFRQNLSKNSLSYGAAYYPWVTTTWSRKISGNAFLFANYSKNGEEVKDLKNLFDQKTLDAFRSYNKFVQQNIRLKVSDARARINSTNLQLIARELYKFLKDFYALAPQNDPGNYDDPFTKLHREYVTKNSPFHVLLKKLQVLFVRNQMSLQSNNFSADFSPLTFGGRYNFVKDRNRTRKVSSSGNLKSLIAEAEQMAGNFFDDFEKLHFSLHQQLKQLDAMYNSVLLAIESQKVIVPPCGAVAGIMYQVDRQKGVWKAPANIGINSVSSPAVDISRFDQESLNVDPVDGKSVNAIRFFEGRGVLVWGARTLAGNDNEWRYINVRRFCIMVEQSIVETLRPFLLEPNNETAWARIRILISNFYNSLWRAGALQGVKPEEAYFVKMGLGVTMSAIDIKNGVMKLVSGLAVVRPAEFIILSISRKMMIN